MDVFLLLARQTRSECFAVLILIKTLKHGKTKKARGENPRAWEVAQLYFHDVLGLLSFRAGGDIKLNRLTFAQ